MSTGVKRLAIGSSVVVVVDVQDRLLAKIPGGAGMVRNTAFLLDAAAILGVPVRATEQYPRGLGPTTVELARRLQSPIPSKTSFSCCGAPVFLEEIRGLLRPDVVLVGMETHVCISQTALDLLGAGLNVFLPVDALAARAAIDHETALRRLHSAGAIPTTVEAVAFEWLGDAQHPLFKSISKLVIERSNGI